MTNLRDVVTKHTNTESIARVYAEAYAAYAGRGQGHADAAYFARSAVINFLKMIDSIHKDESIL